MQEKNLVIIKPELKGKEIYMNQDSLDPQLGQDQTGVKPKASIGKTVGKVFLFVGLFTILAPLLIIASLILNSQRAYKDPEPSQSVLELRPSASEYLSQVEANRSLIPSFKPFGSAVFNRGLPCPEAYESPDVCLLATSQVFKEKRNAEICEEVSMFAKELGATHDSIPGDANMVELSSGSLARCETALNSYPRSVGWGWFSPAYFLQGEASNGATFAIQLSLTQLSPNDASKAPPVPNLDVTKLAQENFEYYLITSTNYDTPDPIDSIPNYSDSKIQLAALLDTFAYYRRSNPDLPYFDPTFARNMIAEYKSSFRFEGEVEEFVDEADEVHWVTFIDQGKLEVCVSVGANKEEIATENPDTMGSMLQIGLPRSLSELEGVGKIVSSRTSPHAFGDYAMGRCE
jgi:hypothetical protein